MGKFNDERKRPIPQNRGRRKTQRVAKPHIEEQEVDSLEDVGEYEREAVSESEKKSVFDQKTIAMIAVGAVAVVLVGAWVIFGKNDDKEIPTQEVIVDTSNKEERYPNGVYDEYGNLVSKDGVYDLDGNVISSDAIDPGEKNYDEIAETADAVVYDDTDFIKDLNGIDVKAKYNVANREFVYDYVSYTSKRAIVDDGLELYWLEAIYHEKKYRIQVPFYRYQVLGDNGICKVQMEVLTLEGGGKIISYMRVVDDDTR